MPIPTATILAGTAIVAMAGLADDLRKGVPSLLRLCLQITAASLVILGTGGLDHLPFPEPMRLELGYAAWPVALVWIVGVTNIYNFLDGIDGYAATQGLIAAAAIACLSPFTAIGITGLVILGACLGFLPHNWHRASVFMGDVGSLTLGFLLATLPLHASMAHRADLVFATAIALWFFLADGAFTLARRALKGEKFWMPHRTHLYQRLVRAGLRHNQVVWIMAVGAVPLACTAIVAVREENVTLQWLSIALGVAFSLVFRQITHLAEALRPTLQASPLEGNVNPLDRSMTTAAPSYLENRT
jgi:UDP-N-acetylmuramyl pentapeptide phosphotransferase/UDP-N-acetylglucosamine-1-phosphate transferase